MRLPILALLVACSSPSWKPPDLAETTRIQEKLIVRYEPDNTISVTAQVALGDVSASGHVFLRRSDLAKAAKSEHVRLARARAWHTLAVMMSAYPERALQAAIRGTEEIRRSIRVDSRASMLANLSVMNSDIPGAARTMTEFLHFSLRSYVRRFHADVW